MDKIDFVKYYIVRKKNIILIVFSMEKIDKVTIQRILKGFKNSFYKSKTKTKHNQEIGRRLNFIYVREHI